MDKNAKMVIIGLLICALGLCFAMCSDEIVSSIVPIITGEDGKCDYCGTSENVIKRKKEESCVSCYISHGNSNYWE